MAVINEMLEAGIAGVSGGVNSDETERIRNVFGSFAQNRGSFFEQGLQPEDSAIQPFEEIEEAGGGEVVEVVEEVVEDEIPATTDETIGATDAEEYVPAEELEDVPPTSPRRQPEKICLPTR